MPQDPSNSPIRVTKQMEEALAECFSAEDIKRVMRDALLEQNLVEKDPYDQNILHVREEATPAASATRFGAKVTINGKVHVAEGATQAEADAKIAEVIRGATTHLRDDAGRFTNDQGRADEAAAKAAEQEIVRKSDLELRFKRGEIDTATYLAESGAVGDFFAKKGIALEDVEAAAQIAAGERITQSWSEATTEFMNSAEGKIWPGGEDNKLKLIEVIAAMGATDAPNAENLRRAAVYMRENNLFVGNPEAEREQAILDAKTPEELAAALHGEKYTRSGSADTWQSRTWNGHG